MKKICFMIGVILCVAACATPDNHTQLKGIDYSSYERPVIRPSDDYTASLPRPSIFDEYAHIPAATASANTEQDYTPAEDEDFTSAEIASSYGRYTDVTVVAAAKRIKLGAGATSKHMALFQRALDAGYKKALRTYRPAGFTYSIASVGAVNPLSDIEVSCILEEHAANEVGQTTCNLFFATVVQRYNSLLQEAKNNATL